MGRDACEQPFALVERGRVRGLACACMRETIRLRARVRGALVRAGLASAGAALLYSWGHSMLLVLLTLFACALASLVAVGFLMRFSHLIGKQDSAVGDATG